MFKFYFLQSIRNVKRDKTSFFVNLIGLTSALVCVLLIYLWVNDELKMDKFHANDKQLYKVMFNMQSTQGIMTLENTPAIMAKAMKEDFPEIEHAVAVNDFFNYSTKDGILSDGDNHINARGTHAGKDYFNVFSIKLLWGDKDKLLTQKHDIVISEILAKKLFNTPENSIGKTLNWKHANFEGNYTVSGVYRSPQHSSIKPYDVIFNLDILLDNDSFAGQWTNSYAQTFVVLKKGTDLNAFNKKIENYIATKHSQPDNSTIFLQQYSKKYLHDQYFNGIPSGGRILYVRIFSIIAIFILIIACINYVNLSTAKASGRLKDVGVKKSIGASRKSLFLQYLCETIIISILSLLIAFIISMIILPQFNILTGKELSLYENIEMLVVSVILTLIVGILAGIYPALYISGFKPALILKGKLKTSMGELLIRKGLVVFQFALSVIFILGFIVLNKQIKFIQNKNLGYNKDNVISFQWKGKYEWGNWNNNDFDVLISELEKVPGVTNITSMSGNILDNIYAQGGITWSGDESEKEYNFKSPVVGYNFIETLGMELKEGRTFSREFNDDYSKIILNEAAVKLMGFENPVGQQIAMNGACEIIGVVKDFHYGSLHEKIEPLIFRFQPIGQNIFVKIEPASTIETIEQIRKLNKKLYPNYPFEFTFLNDDYQSLYESESKTAALSKYFAIIALIISCLGMFGLSAFMAQKRTKEIGIRKVHGSTSYGILKLLSVDFIRLVIISIFIAFPIGFLIIKNWLNGFAYRIEIEGWVFIFTGLITLTISLLTVGMQALKAANINPAISLKDE